MAGVRPAGSAESWQSWMESLAKQTEESVQSPRPDEASPAPATPAHATPPVPAEMSAEDFAAVEAEAMRAEIGSEELDEDEGGENEAEEPAHADTAGIRHEFDPNESQSGRVEPWSAPKLSPPPESAATAAAPDFDSAPGFNWDAPAARREEPTPASPRSEETMPRSSESPARGASTPTPPAIPPAAPAGATSPTDDFDTLEVRRVEATPPPPPPTSSTAASKPRVAPIPPPSGPVAAALPMRLRERLEEAERAEAAQKNGLVGWLIGAAVLAAIVIGVFLTMRFRQHAPPAATPTSAATPAPATPTSPPATATSPPATETATTTGDTRATPLAAPPAAVAPKPTATAIKTPSEPAKPAVTPTKPAVTTTPATSPPPTATATMSVPKSKPAAKPAASAPTTKAATSAIPKPAAATKARFGVSVGSFLAEDRAKSESERLAAATGLAAHVVSSKDGDFLVVLGGFADRAAAEKAAGNLINGGKVEEARVVPLGASH